MFQCHRSYPKGLPSFYRDYADAPDPDSSDSEVNEQIIDSKSQRQSILMHKLTKQYGFKRQRVEEVIAQHPNASYEKILEILTDIKSKSMPISPPQTNKKSV